MLSRFGPGKGLEKSKAVLTFALLTEQWHTDRSFLICSHCLIVGASRGPLRLSALAFRSPDIFGHWIIHSRRRPVRRDTIVIVVSSQTRPRKGSGDE